MFSKGANSEALVGKMTNLMSVKRRSHALFEGQSVKGMHNETERGMDRLMEMEAFANVVDQGGFTDAARKMGISKSAVSKHISSLEARLGARLLNRTTRRVSPTEIGLAYYDRARRVLNDAGEADALVASFQAAPSGLLKVAAANDLSPQFISALVTKFLAKFPEVNVTMLVADESVSGSSEDFDVSLRIGEPDDQTFRSQHVTQATKRLIASKDYLQRYGIPKRLDDLSSHRLLHYTHPNSDHVWSIKAPSGEVRQIRTSGTLAINDDHSLLNACIAGVGIAYLPSFIFKDAMADGSVVDIMPMLPVETLSIHAVYHPSRVIQSKVSAFLDFLKFSFAEGGEVGC